MCIEKKTLALQFPIMCLQKHSTDRPYTCDMCQKQFSRNHNLMTHMWIHNQEKQHTCEICAKTFTYQSNLQVLTEILIRYIYAPYILFILTMEYSECFTTW